MVKKIAHFVFKTLERETNLPRTQKVLKAAYRIVNQQLTSNLDKFSRKKCVYFWLFGSREFRVGKDFKY